MCVCVCVCVFCYLSDRAWRWPGTDTQSQRKDRLSTLPRAGDGREGPLPPPSQPRGINTTPLVRAALDVLSTTINAAKTTTISNTNTHTHAHTHPGTRVLQGLEGGQRVRSAFHGCLMPGGISCSPFACFRLRCLLMSLTALFAVVLAALFAVERTSSAALTRGVVLMPLG